MRTLLRNTTLVLCLAAAAAGCKGDSTTKATPTGEPAKQTADDGKGKPGGTPAIN